MRELRVWIGCLLWVAVALLMPLSALEPVLAAAPVRAVPAAVADVCGDGGARLAMGCESIHL